MHFPRMAIEAESPEQLGYDRVRFNLTESSVRDRSLGDVGVDLGALSLCYTDHFGRTDLREAIAARAGGGLGGGDVLLTAGASAALFVVAISLLDRSDHMIVLRPNYATNIETPRILGCEVDCLDLDFDQKFTLGLEALAARIRPTTRLISLTTPHNPTGAMIPEATLRAVLDVAERAGVHVLVDETYRDMAFVPPAPVAATLSARAISVGSLSKSYGVPGIRVGWIMTRDPALLHRFLCAKEQIGICGSVVDEAIAERVYSQTDAWLAASAPRLAAAFAQVQAWIAREPLLEWVPPSGGCVCFPRIRADAGVDTDAFYRILNDTHGAYVGPGHWFEQSDRYMRIGYGWPLAEELQGGLSAISAALRASIRP
jgi:aspartate/methionine/tyrosine aminotransferase